MKSSARAEHPMPYRIIWTWDSWVCNPFDAASYVTEYQRLIDFMAEWDYNGLIIWGFIDERHGGEASAKEIASYGSRKGVRIMPGIGAGIYEGFVMDRGHRFNISTFLKDRPDLQGFRRSDPSRPQEDTLCLYQEDSLKWLREGAAWLAENFEIGGVNIETNEAGTIDVCPFAAKATADEPNRLKYSASFSDLSIAVPVIHDELAKSRPGAWTTYATYQPPWWERQEDSWILKELPQDTIAQWNIEMDVTDGVPPPVADNISLIHSGAWSYHLSAFPPIWGFTQHRCFYPNLEQARQFARNQHRLNSQGIVIGNAGSSVMPDNEIAYIAYVEFLRNPGMTIDEFSSTFIGRLYGRNAEPPVKRLMLDQPAIHESLRGVWWAWASLMARRKVESLPVANPADIECLKGQIEAAKKAWDAADDGGRDRLAVIIQVLDEYRIIAELSADPRMSRLTADLALLDDAGLSAELHKLVDIVSAAGLPADMYRYTELLG